MKNIHVLPTDKQSRLYLHSDNELQLRTNIIRTSEDYLGSNQHIYITSDEEIKTGDWYYLPRTNLVYECTEDPTELNLERSLGVRKIILTTDQDLIKDGVQAIDDEFLEWFVKNPSCEWVEVNHFGMCCGNQLIAQCINCNQYNPIYKIIIPKEELEQETLEEVVHEMLVDYGIKSIGQSIGVLTVKKLMVNMAKWQAERMYSEEDMREAFKGGGKISWTDIDDFNEWFEQFKKK